MLVLENKGDESFLRLMYIKGKEATSMNSLCLALFPVRYLTRMFGPFLQNV